MSYLMGDASLAATGLLLTRMGILAAASEPAGFLPVRTKVHLQEEMAHREFWDRDECWVCRSMMPSIGCRTGMKSRLVETLRYSARSPMTTAQVHTSTCGSNIQGLIGLARALESSARAQAIPKIRSTKSRMTAILVSLARSNYPLL
jgi:hypothetical protein